MEGYATLLALVVSGCLTSLCDSVLLLSTISFGACLALKYWASHLIYSIGNVCSTTGRRGNVVRLAEAHVGSARLDSTVYLTYLYFHVAMCLLVQCVSTLRRGPASTALLNFGVVVS